MRESTLPKAWLPTVDGEVGDVRRLLRGGRRRRDGGRADVLELRVEVGVESTHGREHTGSRHPPASAHWRTL